MIKGLESDFADLQILLGLAESEVIFTNDCITEGNISQVGTRREDSRREAESQRTERRKDERKQGPEQ